MVAKQARLAIIRRIVLLPGREAEGIAWLHRTEPARRKAGQVRQLVIRGQIDPHEYRWLQVWESAEAYESWRRSPEREALAAERGRYMTHEPTRVYDLLE